MESRTLLDYALFQLTPTRTRCDLVIFAGRKSEKLASGLLGPFLSHLKSAKDQISKGGYSITLQPTASDVSWFTKATLERFVRFVSTPEVLERFVTTEREICQIEISIVSNEQANGTAKVQADANFKVQAAPSKLKVESSDSRDDEPQEKPKVRLQRVLESRKALLKKEQAMAYARSLVAGFDMDYIHDLVSFSDAFGALRLREACINFSELCNKKNDDKVWMDEIAAMQACSHSELSYLGTSGIILASENNSPTKASVVDSMPSHGSLDANEDNGFPVEFNVQPTEGVAQVPTWANHLPHYMQNFQGPIFQQIPPYPGYVFPGMQVASSHYPDKMLWPSNFQDSSVYLDKNHKNSRGFKSFTKKEKISNDLQSRSTKHGEDIETENSISGSDSSDSQEHEPNLSSREKMHNKKRSKHSSRKVVIRNINYITSGRIGEKSRASESDSSDEDEFIDADSFKLQVEEAVGSLKRHQKPSTHQNKVQGGSKKSSNKSKDALDDENGGTTISEERKDGNWDIFQNLIMRDADSRSTDMGAKSIEVQEEYFTKKFNGEENLSSLTNKVPKGYASDAFLLNERPILNGIEASQVKFEDGENFREVVKMSSKDEELLIPPRAEAGNYSLNAHFGSESSIIKSQKEEDWLKGNQPGQGERVDHAILFDDQASACYNDHLQVDKNKRDVIMDDSFMVQSRLSDNPLETRPKADIFMVADIVGVNQSNHSMLENLQSKVKAGDYNEPNDLCMVLGRDYAADQVVASWKPDMECANENSLAPQCSTKPIDSVKDTLLFKDNESKIKTRIVPGKKVDAKATNPKPPISSLGRSKSEVTSRSKISPLGSRMIKSKSEKEEEKTKKLEELRIQRQKRIAERSASKGFTSETSRSLKESKKNTVSTKIEKPKLQASSDKSKSSQKDVMRNSTINRLAAARTTNKQLSTESKKTTPRESSAMATPSMKKTWGTRQGQDKVNPSDKKTVTNNLNDNSSNIPKMYLIDTIPSVSEETISAEVTTDDKNCIQVLSDKDLFSLENISSEMKPLSDTDDHAVLSPQITVHPTIGNNLRFPALNIAENHDDKNKLSISSEISMAGISTPPPNAETIPGVIHSRKKWNNGESSPKAPKGFRKLLLFGRKI